MSRKVLVMGNMLNKKELSHEINVNKNYNNVPSSHDSVFLFTLFMPLCHSFKLKKITI